MSRQVIAILDFGSQYVQLIARRVREHNVYSVICRADTSAQQLTAWRMVVSKRLSVRQTEELIRRLKSEKKRPKVAKKTSEDRYFADLSETLSRHFGTKVAIRRNGQRGKVEIDFYSNDDLDRLIGLLKS